MFEKWLKVYLFSEGAYLDWNEIHLFSYAFFLQFLLPQNVSLPLPLLLPLSLCICKREISLCVTVLDFELTCTYRECCLLRMKDFL